MKKTFAIPPLSARRTSEIKQDRIMQRKRQKMRSEKAKQSVLCLSFSLSAQILYGARAVNMFTVYGGSSRGEKAERN